MMSKCINIFIYLFLLQPTINEYKHLLNANIFATAVSIQTIRHIHQF